MNLEEKLREIYDRDHWACQAKGCEKRATQVAHRIAKGKYNKIMVRDYVLQEYGISVKANDIIHHPLNLVCSCSTTGHNDSFNVGNNPGVWQKLVRKIFKDLRERGKYGRNMS